MVELLIWASLAQFLTFYRTGRMHSIISISSQLSRSLQGTQIGGDYGRDLLTSFDLGVRVIVIIYVRSSRYFVVCLFSPFKRALDLFIYIFLYLIFLFFVLEKEIDFNQLKKKKILF